MTARPQRRRKEKKVTLSVPLSDAERLAQDHGVADLLAQWKDAALAARIWLSGDARIRAADLLALTGVNPGTLKNHRNDPSWPQPFTLRPTTYRLADIATFVWDRHTKALTVTDSHGQASP